jgi:hypothetical protein
MPCDASSDEMGPSRQARYSEFEIAIICALTVEADAAEGHFDKH